MNAMRSQRRDALAQSAPRRWMRALAVVLVAGVVAACGSDNNDGGLHRVVVFGDSISDMGTHQVGVVAALGGGRYTVSPAQVWSERAAQSLGYPMTVGMHGGFSAGLEICPQPPNCTNWPNGGARVTLHPGIYEYADGSGQLAKTVKDRIELHLARFDGKFDNNDLVLAQAGGNDAFYPLGVFSAMMAQGATQEQASAAVVTAMATGGLIQDGSALFCTTRTLIDGDTSRFFFANDVHPTPYGHELLANAYLAEIERNHWR